MGTEGRSPPGDARPARDACGLHVDGRGRTAGDDPGDHGQQRLDQPVRVAGGRGRLCGGSPGSPREVRCRNRSRPPRGATSSGCWSTSSASAGWSTSPVRPRAEVGSGRWGAHTAHDDAGPTRTDLRGYHRDGRQRAGPNPVPPHRNLSAPLRPRRSLGDVPSGHP